VKTNRDHGDNNSQGDDGAKYHPDGGQQRDRQQDVQE